MISVGVDAAKGKSTVCVMKPFGEVVRTPFDVVHTDEAVDEFIGYLSTLHEEIRVIMEATGVYHLPMLLRLKEAGYFVTQINPLMMKKYMSLSLRKAKTDKIDAVRIANYGLDNWNELREYQASEKNYEELKLLGRQYAHYVKMKVASKLALDKILSGVMPGIKTHLRSNAEDFAKDKLSDFVEEYVHYDNIAKMAEDEFTDSYCKWAKEKDTTQIQARHIRYMQLQRVVSQHCPPMPHRPKC